MTAARVRASLARYLTAGALAATAGLHVAWGGGSSFPFSTRDELADAVIGRAGVPGPGPCRLVAGALAVAAGMVTVAPARAPRWRRAGLIGIAGVLGLRGVLGLAGRTDLVSPGSDSVRFRRLDRRCYGPLCLALSLGVLGAARQTGAERAHHRSA